MLYFSKFRIIFIISISLLFIFIASSNILKFSNSLLNKKINLGLDLQGGSYLLLEIDNTPVIEQKLQNFTISLRNFFKEKNIRIQNIKLSNQMISFSVDSQFRESIIEEFKKEESELNQYYPRFKSHQLDKDEIDNVFYINFSRQGII